MPDLDSYFDEIDLARLRRIKELSEIKRIFISNKDADPFAVNSKAVVVLSYASWEGFYNECIEAYCRFLSSCETRIIDIGWTMLVGALSSEFDSLRSRNHSREAREEFVRKLKSRLECKFDEFDKMTISARSNLNFSRLSGNYSILGFDTIDMQKHRIRIDKEIVGWRHSIAHGDSPVLSEFEVSKHIDFVADLLVLLADRFQQAMLERI